jgi:hypothetical protein
MCERMKEMSEVGKRNERTGEGDKEREGERSTDEGKQEGGRKEH